MADTIITNTPDSGDNAMGGIAVAIILAVLVVGSIVLYQTGVLGTMSDPAKSDTTEINVTVPTPTPAPIEPKSERTNGGSAQLNTRGRFLLYFNYE